MDALYSDIIKLLIEQYFDAKDSLALFCTSKNFSVYQRIYHIVLIDARKELHYCVVHGKLDALKFFYARKHFNFHIQKNWIFLYSCHYGYLDMAKWIYQLGIKLNSLVDIHYDHDMAFIMCCRLGYLKIAQWLYQLGIEINSPVDINIRNDNAFKWSCYNDHHNICEWLIKLGIESNTPINQKLIRSYQLENTSSCF